MFRFSVASRSRRRRRLRPLRWALALYFCGVLAHFSNHLALGLPEGLSFDQALASAPTSLAWPADLIGTLMALT